MMRPTYRNLGSTGSREEPSVSICSGPSSPQGNPRFYKYHWRVFSLESPWEDSDFFRYAPVLCNADCQREVERLLEKRLSCMIYGFRRPRKDPHNPWDMTHARWAGIEFAVSWEEDTDPVVEGGHR
jgi:hypothetical protein